MDWTRRDRGTNPHFRSCGLSHLWTNSEFLSVHIKSSGIGRSDRTWKDFKVGIANEDKETLDNLDNQSGSNPKAGGWLASFFFNSFFLQSFFLIKYFYNYNTVSVYGVRKWTKYALTWYLLEVFMIKCPKHKPWSNQKDYLTGYQT